MCNVERQDQLARSEEKVAHLCNEIELLKAEFSGERVSLNEQIVRFEIAIRQLEEDISRLQNQVKSVSLIPPPEQVELFERELFQMQNRVTYL